MIKKQGIARAFTLGLLTAATCGVAFAQQGWARLQTIKTGARIPG